MDNLGDVCYLMRLIIHQIFVYLKDLILYEFSWFLTTSDYIDDLETKFRENTSRYVTRDVMVLSTICGLLFILMIVSGKSTKDEESHCDIDSSKAFSINRAPMDLFQAEHVFCMRNGQSSGINCCAYACGDSICPSENVAKQMLSNNSPFSRMQHCENANFTESSFLKTQSVQLRHSQSTQTTCIFQKAPSPQGWLIRRTRSGHIYGKYPL